MMSDAMNETGNRSKKKKERKRKGPAKADPESLARAAYWYLERFATSTENLRRVLMRRVEKAARASAARDNDRDTGGAAVEAIIRRLSEDGLLNDGSYAEARVRSLRAAGKPARAIKWSLAGKGVEAEIINQAISAVDTENACEGEEADFRAAVCFAKRRRLGPCRETENRDAFREKDLAALARAGFSYGVAERVIKAESREELEREDVRLHEPGPGGAPG